MNTLSTYQRKDMLHTFFLVLGYELFFYCLQLFLYHAGFVNTMPGEDTLLRWDAGVYQHIAQHGYTIIKDGVNNTGCYVLFPWIWRLLHASVQGICIINFFFFAAGFTLITGIYPVSIKEKMLWLSTPSLYFMFVPYTEALFCLLVAFLFYGIYTRSKWQIWVALFLVSLTRATSVFLIPSLLIMELLTNNREDLLRTLFNYFLHYAAPTLAGLSVFILVQYYDTGVWLAYYKQQVKCLGHQLSWPALPFSNPYSGDKFIWLSGLAILVCLVALIMICHRIYFWLFKNKVFTDKVFILTLGYLPVILCQIIFCNPKWGVNVVNTTNLLGIQRYALCTPFIFVFLYHLVSKSQQYTFKHFIAMFILCNLVWLSTGSYVHIQQWLFFNFNTLLVFGYMLHANKRKEWATFAVIAVNILLQATLYQMFLANVFTD